MVNKVMKNIKRFKQIAFSLAILGFMSAVFLFGLTFGLGIGWEITYKDFEKVATIGTNEFQYMAFSYLFISVFLVLFIAFLQMRDKVFLKVTALVPLAFMTLQCRILIMSKPDSLPDWVTEYSSWLEIILYMDFCFLALSFVLLILDLYLIRLIYYSSLTNNS